MSQFQEILTFSLYKQICFIEMVGVLNLVPYFSHQTVRIDISLSLSGESKDDSRFFLYFAVGYVGCL